MLRLALIGDADAAAYARIASRLRASLTSLAPDDLDAGRVDGIDAVLLRGKAVQLGERAAALGKHVLAEDPPGAARAEALVAASASVGVTLMLGQRSRFSPAVQVIRSSLDAGKLGEAGLIRSHRWQPGHTSLVELLTHDIDLACWLFGQPPSRLYAVGRTGYLQLHLGFAGGGMALLDATRALPDGADYYSLSLIGSAGAAYADDHHNAQLVFAGGPATARRTEQGDLALLGMLRAFLAAVEDRRSITDSLVSLQIAEAVPQSLSTRQVLVREGERYLPAEVAS